MEQKNSNFTVICNEKKYLEDSIQWYNKNYKTDFEIIDFIEDEVNFAEIKVTKYKLSDIFRLGYQFGVKEQKLREKGQIDW